MALTIKPQTIVPPKNPNFLNAVREQDIKASEERRKQLHPAAQEAAAMYSHALEAVDRLEAENIQLKNDLEIERRHCNELQHQLDHVSERRDYFYRYAIEVRTHLQTIVQSATMADNRALEVAKNEPTKPQIEKPADALEQDLADAVQTLKKAESE